MISLSILGAKYLSVEVISIPRSIAEKLRLEASRLGLSLEEYIIELAVQNLDPPLIAQEYIKAAKELLEQSKQELKRGNVRQAAEKLWGSASLAIKAYIAWKKGKKIMSHRELWEYRRIVEKDLGEWVYDAWMTANGMHTCFYEGWCGIDDVEQAIKRIGKLVYEVAGKIEA